MYYKPCHIQNRAFNITDLCTYTLQKLQLVQASVQDQ